MKVSDQSSIVGWVIWFCTLGVRIFVVGHPAIINCHANTTWWIAGAFAQHKLVVEPGLAQFVLYSHWH